MKISMTAFRICFAAAFTLPFLVLGSAWAQNVDILGEFKKWQAYQYNEGSGTRCTMAAQPDKDEGDYSSRGKIWAFVMHRPSEGANGEVGFHMGYPIKDGTTVTVKIGGSTFRLYTSGQGAYAWREDEPKLIRAMRAGATMVVTGTSARGTETKDTYSLSGFTAANNAINQACGVG